MRSANSGIRAAYVMCVKLSPTAEAYTPPQFAAELAHLAPRQRLRLAVAPTPIHDWRLPGLPHGVELAIKRDDMTGCATSGNKVRKLEFLLADALARGCDNVITGGGVQSNHARATAALCAQLGLPCHVVLRARRTEPEKLGADGNVLLHRLFGSHVHLTRVGPGLKGKMNVLAERLNERGKRAYVIDIGGSDRVGVWRYLQCYAELVEQGATERYTDIVMAVGSGGTASGIAIGNHLCGSPLRVHAVGVCDTPQYFYDHVQQMADELGLDVDARQLISIVDNKGRGYAQNTRDDLVFCRDVARETGIVLDRVYTGKAARWLDNELRKENGMFAGRNAKVLFLHTGGLFGVFDKEIEAVLQDDLISEWKE